MIRLREAKGPLFFGGEISDGRTLVAWAWPSIFLAGHGRSSAQELFEYLNLSCALQAALKKALVPDDT